MKAKLLARTGATGDVDLVFGARAKIGRSENNTLVLDSKAISSHHAEVVFDQEAGAYFLVDLESLNGTYLDGSRVRRRERLGKLHAISLGGAVDLIYIGLDEDPGEDTDVVSVPAKDGKTSFDREIPTLPEELRSAAGASQGTQVERMAVALPEALGGAVGSAPTASERKTRESSEVSAAAAPTPTSSFFLEFEDSGDRRYLKEGDNLIGRLRTADVSFSSPDLSRRHATVTVDAGKVTVRDEGSRNHTFVDGEQIDAETAVKPGSVVHFGRIAARLGGAPGETDEER